MRSMLIAAALALSPFAMAEELVFHHPASQTPQQSVAEVPEHNTYIVRIPISEMGKADAKFEIATVEGRIPAGKKVAKLKFEQAALDSEPRNIAFNSGNELEVNSSTKSWGFRGGSYGGNGRWGWGSPGRGNYGGYGGRYGYGGYGAGYGYGSYGAGYGYGGYGAGYGYDSYGAGYGYGGGCGGGYVNTCGCNTTCGNWAYPSYTYGSYVYTYAPYYGYYTPGYYTAYCY